MNWSLESERHPNGLPMVSTPIGCVQAAKRRLDSPFPWLGRRVLASLAAASSCFVAGMTLPADAQASLISTSSSFGADTLTTDTATNLQWLDVPLTLGLSINQVKAQLQAGGTYAGYRYATSAEIATLMLDAGLSSSALWLDQTPANVSAVQTLIGLLGETMTAVGIGGAIETYVYGWEGDTTGYAGPGADYAAVLRFQPAGSLAWPCDPVGCASALAQGEGFLTGPGTPIGSWSEPYIGSFLVRDAPPDNVSEPGALGLAALASSTRRMSKAVRQERFA